MLCSCLLGSYLGVTWELLGSFTWGAPDVHPGLLCLNVRCGLGGDCRPYGIAHAPRDSIGIQPHLGKLLVSRCMGYQSIGHAQSSNRRRRQSRPNRMLDHCRPETVLERVIFHG